jgi:hypothetical protein
MCLRTVNCVLGGVLQLEQVNTKPQELLPHSIRTYRTDRLVVPRFTLYLSMAVRARVERSTCPDQLYDIVTQGQSPCVARTLHDRTNMPSRQPARLRESLSAGSQEYYFATVSHWTDTAVSAFRFRYVLHPFAAKYSHWMWH